MFVLLLLLLLFVVLLLLLLLRVGFGGEGRRLARFSGGEEAEFIGEFLGVLPLKGRLGEDVVVMVRDGVEGGGGGVEITCASEL